MELSKAQEDSRFQEPIDWAALWAKWRGPLIRGTTLFLLGILFFHYFIKLYRRARHIWSNNPRHVYISAVDSLSENGVRRERGESPEAFARRVQSATFLRITHAHIAYALGREPIKSRREPTAMVLKERTDIPLWRRCVGFLNPFSFYLSR